MPIEELPYHPDGLLARLHVPDGPGPFPGVLSVHGGAWTFGDRMMNEGLHRRLAAAGLLVMAPEMRKPPVARYPGSIQDIHLAARWLKAEGPRWGMRPGGIAGLGTSSGGHQAALLALRPRHSHYATLPGPAGDGALTRLALCWPVADPLARYRMAKATGARPLFEAHEAWWPDEATMEDASPQHILDRGEATAPPPLLVIQGGADANVTPGMAPRFAQAWCAAGGQAALRLFPGRGHLFATQDPEAPDSQAAIAAIIAFLREG